MKFRVMLVDDEAMSLKGLQSLVDWKEQNCEVVGTAFSAISALEQIDALSPHIIITDLVMPEMDGIEFITIIKKHHPEIEIIILSGYGEFDYAQKAIKNDVCEFLVKPVTRGQILEALNKTSAKIIAAKKKENILEAQKKLLEKSVPLLRNKYMLEMLKGNAKDKEEIIRKCKLINLKFNQSAAVCVLAANIIDDDNIMIVLSIKDFCERFFDGLCRAHIVLDNEYICIVMYGKECEINDGNSYKHTAGLCEGIKRKFGIQLTAGIGPCCPDFAGIHASYNAARNAALSGFFMGEGCIIHHSNAIENHEHCAYPYKKAIEIIDKIKFKSDCDAKLIADEMMTELINASGYNVDVIYDYLHHFCIQLAASLHNQASAENNESSNMQEIIDSLKKSANIEELGDSLVYIIEYELVLFDKLRKKKANLIIDKAKAYIDGNMSGDLSLNAMSCVVFMSPAYFSAFFKQATGVNYHDYVIGEKMKFARSQLIEERKKVYEVSQMVGYVNTRSFSSTFKRYWGENPSDYVKSFFATRREDKQTAGSQAARQKII